jgi:V8-like Glu-specific endopeptidase
MSFKFFIAVFKGLLSGLLFALISGCVSLPAPDAKDMEAVPNLMQDYRTKLKAGEYDQAIAVLQQIQKRVTKSGELSGGKGRFFRDEAQAAALIGHIEFKRKNISEAESKWSESFEIEFNGLTAQHEVDQRNQDISDALANSSAAGSAKKSALKKGRRTYSYPIQNTVLAKPQMIATGKPTESIVRMPVRVEDSPFDSIVKLSNNNRSSCTATMVAPRVAISAAHCLSQNGEAIDPSVITLKRFGIFESPTLRVQEYYTHKGMNKEWDRNRRNDWVILVTLAAINKFTEYPVVLKKIPEPVLGGTETIMLAGYSSDLNKGFYPTLHHGCTFKVGQKELAGVFLSNCDNAKGASGAAVMTTKSPYNIIAIHTAHLVSPKDDF